MIIWVLWPIKIISLILSFKIISLILRGVNRKVEQKQEIPKQNHLTTHKQNLACLTCDPS